MKIAHYLLFTTTLCLTSTSLIATQSDDKTKHEHVMLTPSDFTWIDGPEGLPGGAKVTVLEGNPAKAGPFTIRVKMPANYKIKPHWHPAIEHVTVLQGTFHMGEGDKFDESKGKELPVGSFAAIPTKSHHYAYSGDEEVIVQLHGVGPWEISYIDPNDDPRKKKVS